MQRIVILFAACLMVLLYVALRGQVREQPADFRYLNPSDIHTLDPARMSWTQDFRIAINIWEGLTAIDPTTMQPIAGAAHFPPEVSADGTAYRFIIRDDARWSNGDPVVAADFVRGWRRAMEPGTAADYSVFFTDHVAGARQYVDFRRDFINRLTGLRNGFAESNVSGNSHALRRGDNSRAASRTGAVSDPLTEHADRLDHEFARVGLRAPDDRTLEVTLVRPCAYFLDLTAGPVFSPIHESIERLRQREKGTPLTAEGLVVYDPQWTKPEPRGAYPGLITNGPYRLADWTLKRRARLVVNAFHREAASIACRTIDMVVYDNVDAALLAYEAGDLDFIPGIDVSYAHEIARLAGSGARPDFHLCPVLATMFLNFNCTSSTVNGRTNPFADARVRRAFALAINKQALVDTVLGRGDRVAYSLVPPDSIPNYAPPDGVRRDDGQARALMAEAGYPDGAGFPPALFLHTVTDERLCQALARMWQRSLGVRIELQAKESKTFADDKQNRRYMIAKGNWYADYGDATTFLDILETGNGNNDSGFSHVAFDHLLKLARDETDVDRRAALLREAEAIAVEDQFPIVPILHYVTLLAISPRVEGLHPNPRLWFPFKDLRVRP